MKAILVIDMPSECIKCPFQAFEYCHPLRKEIPMQNIAICEKPEWCPLKPIPSEYCVSNKDDQFDNERWFYGYNKAIRDIVGDENIEY